MRKMVFFQLCWWLTLSGSMAQTPTQLVDFDAFASERTINGVVGKALNLGALAVDRRAVKMVNELHNDEASDFSLLIWVNASRDGQQAYDILSSLTAEDGWRISVQQNGAWKFDVQANGNQYDYAPTPLRQNIRDGHWHLIGITYRNVSEELSFYFDGEKKAIYLAPGIADFFKHVDLTIGGNSDANNTADFTSASDSFYGCIDDITLFNQAVSDSFIQQYYSGVTGVTPHSKRPPLSVLKVATLNLWKGGNQFGREVGRERIIASLRAIDADVNLLVETYGSGPAIADELGGYLYLISSNLSIVSKYPIVRTFRAYKPFHSGGAQIRLPQGTGVNVFCNWLSSTPQYFIKGLTAEDSWPLDTFLEEDRKTRGNDIVNILNDIQDLVRDADRVPVIVGGDFNSGSHLDWTAQTAALHNGYVVPWNASIAMEESGFNDSFREIHPDPLRDPGLTWSPIRSFPLKDRIDYIYYIGKSLQAIHSEVIDTHPLGWPSDHAAVSTWFRIH